MGVLSGSSTLRRYSPRPKPPVIVTTVVRTLGSSRDLSGSKGDVRRLYRLVTSRPNGHTFHIGRTDTPTRGRHTKSLDYP